MLLEDKRIILTGALGGIGIDTSRALLRHGAAVSLTDVLPPDHPRVHDFLEEVAELPGMANYQQMNVASRESVDAGFAAALSALGGLTGLINMAGVDQPTASAETISEQEMRRQFDVHMMGTFFTNQRAFDALKATGGAIVNYSSIVGIEGFALQAAYGAAKGAVAAWTRNAARDWGRFNVRVNTVSPGALTAMVRAAADSMPEDQRIPFYAALDAQVLLGDKLLGPDKIAGANVFLMSDLSSWIHGQTIPVDGGMFMVR